MAELTREQCEAAILAKILEIRDIAAEYMDRTPDFLTTTWYVDGTTSYVNVNNRYYREDGDKPIDKHQFIRKVDAAEGGDNARD